MNGFNFRVECDNDLIAVDEMVRVSFEPHRVDLLLRDLRESDAWRDLSFMVEQEGGTIVGHVSFSRGWLDAPQRLVEVLILSPLCVTPEFQGKGVGRMLVIESLKRLQDRPEPLVFLEGDPDFYSRFGFKPGFSFGFTRPSIRIPETAFQCVQLPGYQSWMSGALVYPEVFWVHDSVGLR